MARKKDLTKREREVLNFLVRYPERKEADLAAMMGISPGVFSIIKKKLYGEYLVTTYLPDLRRIGLEIISITLGKSEEITNLSEREKELTKFLSLKTFGVVRSRESLVTLNGSTTFRELKAVKNIMDNIYFDHPTARGNLTHLVFAPEDILFHEFVNMTGVIGDKEFDSEPLKVEPYKIKSVEMEFLKHGTGIPYPGDDAIAKKIGVSKITVYRARMSLLKKGIIRKKNMLRVPRTANRFMGAVYLTMNTSMFCRLRDFWTGGDDDLLKGIFRRTVVTLGDTVDLFMIGVFPDYTDWEAFIRSIDSWAMEARHPSALVSSILMPTSDVVDFGLLGFNGVLSRLDIPSIEDLGANK